MGDLTADSPFPRTTAAASPGVGAIVLQLAAIFLASRLLLIVVAAVAELSGLAGAGPTFDQRPGLRAVTGWDAVYFLGIAAEGYHAEPIQAGYVDWVFFPLFPLLARAVAFVVGDVTIAGLVVANVASFAALAAVYILGLRHLGHERAIRAVALLSVAPGAVALGLPYSDSLLLLTSASALFMAERRRDLAAGMLYALATLARAPGILLGLPLLAILVAQDGGRPARRWLLLAAGPVALAAFSAYQAAVLGDPLAWMNAQVLWSAPSEGGSPSALTEGPEHAALIALLMGILLVHVPLLVLSRRDRLPLPYLLLAVNGFLTVLLSGQLYGNPRYLAIAFPLSWILASRSGTVARVGLPVLSIALFAGFAFLHFTHRLPP